MRVRRGRICKMIRLRPCSDVPDLSSVVCEKPKKPSIHNFFCNCGKRTLAVSASLVVYNRGCSCDCLRNRQVVPPAQYGACDMFLIATSTRCNAICMRNRNMNASVASPHYPRTINIIIVVVISIWSRSICMTLDHIYIL